MADFPLLNEASLVMIPGATKEGKVYSQVPTDGSGDFTFTRSTSATRVNEAGNIEKGYENLLLQSNSFSDAAWTKTRVDLTSGQAGYDSSNDAWLVTNNNDSFPRLEAVATSSGVSTYSVYIKAGTNSFCQLRTFGADADVWVDLSNGSFTHTTGAGLIDTNSAEISNGWYRLSLIVNGNLTGVRIYSASAFGVYGLGSIYIQDAQLNQGLVAYPYLETTTAPVYGGLQADQPRLDYTDATCPSLLLEPSRTNTVAHSEYFNSSQYNKLNTTAIDNNAIISPEGIQNASKVRASVTSTTALGFENTSITSQYKAFSIFAKAGEISEMLVFGIQVSQGVFFNLNDGSISGYYQGNSSEIDNAYSVDYGNGWYRYIIIWASNSRPRIFTSDNQQITFSQTAGNGFYAYGLQYEDASYPTSYIPTYGSAESRGADDINLLTGVGVTGNEFTIFLELDLSDTPLVQNLGTYFQTFDSSNNSQQEFRFFTSSNNQILVPYFRQDAQYAFGTSTGQPFDGKVLFRADGSGSYTMFFGFNGISTKEVRTGLTAYTLNKIDFTSKPKTNLKQLLIFNEALSDTECIALTTL